MTLKSFKTHFIRANLIGVGVFILLAAIQYFNGRTYSLGGDFIEIFGFEIEYNEQLLFNIVSNQIYSVTLYMVNMVIILTAMRHYGKGLFTIKKMSWLIPLSIVVTIITVYILNVFLYVIRFNYTFSEALVSQSAGDYIFSIIVTTIITSIFYYIFYRESTRSAKVKEQKIIARTASAQFDALKNQLDPHFLFNSLNVLTSLIHENPDQAERFTTSLSKVYRYVLEQKNKELVTVDEELKFAQLYMSLLKMRFEDSIVVDIPEKSYNPEAKVVPLSLQLLLENAVKHNMVTPSKKLHIKIFERDGVLIVQNNLQPKQVVKKSSGVGLQNIKQRYGLLTDREVKINQTARDFAVAIPMLTKQTAVMKTQETYLEDKKYLRVKERVKAIKEFYIHFSIYLIMIPFFIWINWISTSFPWAIFPIVGWGIGVAGHAMEAFNYNPILGKNWEKRKIEQFMGDDDF
ncbi:2TM domain-containing protein [Spongiivirga sp. MCCC 1A20706]|uniref:2TM domain-containing protein n=1 Tax=Spongiivirga sp. MCCC 1A20706 TaxID=3160963 RepID=UPI0039778291